MALESGPLKPSSEKGIRERSSPCKDRLNPRAKYLLIYDGSWKGKEVLQWRETPRKRSIGNQNKVARKSGNSLILHASSEAQVLSEFNEWREKGGDVFQDPVGRAG